LNEWQTWIYGFAALAQAFGAVALVGVTIYYAKRTDKMSQSAARLNELNYKMIEETAKANALTETVIEQNRQANMMNRSLVEEAIKQRVDSIAPFLSLDITIDEINLIEKDAVERWKPVYIRKALTLPDDEDRIVEVVLLVVITNSGKSPAVIQWANTPLAKDMSRKAPKYRRLDNPANLVLLPGANKTGKIRHRKSIKAWLELQNSGSDAQKIDYALVFSDIRKNHMFATIEWYGFLNPLKVDNGLVSFSTDLPLNASAPVLNIEYRLLQKSLKD
jgi:hypothetical protein